MLNVLPRCFAQTNIARQVPTNQEPLLTNATRSASPYSPKEIPGFGLDYLKHFKPSFEAVVEKKTNHTFPVLTSTNHATVQLSLIYLQTLGGQKFIIMEDNPGTNFTRLWQHLEVGKRYRFPDVISDAEQ
jgi:hypothetical protein